MSKKKFLDGLESIFGHASDDNLSENSPLLAKEKPKGRSKAQVTKKRSKSRTRTRLRPSTKNFTSDLNSLFEDALQETMQEQANRLAKGLDSHTLSTKKRNRKPLTGLDALIRNTSDMENFEQELRASIRRVSFAFDAKKYQKLKSIAKQEKAYVKDVLSKIISDFLKNYDRTKSSL